MKKPSKPETAARDRYLTASEWARRLQSARAVALKRLARFGLDPVDCDEQNDDRRRNINNVVATILDTECGAQLTPGLESLQADVEPLFDALRETAIVDPDAVIYNYAAAAVKAAFLFGVITGTATTWETVQAIAPPYVPTAKGGAR